MEGLSETYRRGRAPKINRHRAVAITGTVVAAGAAAYAAHSQASAASDAAHAASAPHTNASSSTSTTTHGSGALQGAIDNTIGAAQQIYYNGPITRKPTGSGVDKTTSSIAQQIEALGQAPPTTVNAANAFAQNLLTGGKSGAAALPTFTPAKLSDLPPPLQAKVNSGALSLSAATSQAVANRPDFAAKFGPQAQAAAQAAAANAPSAAQQALSSNPVAQDLYNRLGGSSLSASDDAIRNFLGGGNGLGGAAAGGGSGPGADPNSPYYGMAVQGGGGQVLASGGMAGGGSDLRSHITDQSSDNSLFSQNAQAILGGKYMDPNDPSLKGYLDALDHRNQLALQSQLDNVGDQFDKVGMYGGSGQALQSAQTRALGLQGMSDADSTAIFNARQQGLAQISDTLGQVNQRDIAGSGMASNESIAASGRAAGAASAADQLALAQRGQNLQAIGMLTQNNQYGIGQLGDLSNNLSQEQMSAAGLAPALNSAQYTGLQNAYNVASDVGKQQASANARNSQIAYQNANAAGQNLDDYMRRLGFVSNVEGSTTTSNSNGTSSGAGGAYGGPDPNAAAIAGAAGAGLSAWGILSQNNGGAQAQPGATGNGMSVGPGTLTLG